MRWSKKNKELIKQVIDRYYWMLKKKSRMGRFFGGIIDCPFCEPYFNSFSNCDFNCPNRIISSLFNIKESEFSCYDNAKYTGLLFRDGAPCKIPSNIKKRLWFWQDTFDLTKKEFIKKYKKKGGNQ